MTSSSRTQPTRVSLEREGVAGLHELQLQQVTAENLRRLFQVSSCRIVEACCRVYTSYAANIVL